VKKKSYRCVLTIAGSDSSGGAGIQADLKTFAALGCYGMSVVTSLTAQNTMRVSAIQEIPAKFIAKQIEAVFEDIEVHAVKIGMLQNVAVVRTVAAQLLSRKISNIVVDPVMISKSGARLLNDNAVGALRSHLLPVATIVTPNIPEASMLAYRRILTRADMEAAAQTLLCLGPKAVLVKGGHKRGSRSADCLCVRRKTRDIDIRWFESKRIESKNTHGTGCTLSSAIAAYLAKGFEIDEAVEKSKQYVFEAIKEGRTYSLGRGHGPVHHFYASWKR
jgi:hydroxymethylpyrimidine/phosphomethylpyrimidine kinase